MQIGYEIGDIERLKVHLKNELGPGRVFKSRGQTEEQRDVYWEVLRREDDGTYVCKVVGINGYPTAK